MGWSVIGAGDFDGDGHTDYALLNSGSGRTAIWYLSGRTFPSEALLGRPFQ